MPFLRVIRDKRGYETTYLMHWYREGNRQRSRILYVFRTPGGVRVGRSSLEPEVLNDIAARHPDITFDWKSVIDNQQIVESAPEVRRPRHQRSAESEQTRKAQGEAAAPGGPEGQSRPPAKPTIPPTIDGSTPDEQIAFLMHWYPIIRARIPERTKDPARQEALIALAERLNPAAWTDADQIAAGLIQASDALERLSRVFARRRRRSRRSSARAEPTKTPAPSVEVESQNGGAAVADTLPTEE